MSNVQTDNSHLKEKIKLRIDTLNLIEKNDVFILDCFSGDGVIWDEILKQTKKNLRILRIEKKQDKKGIYLHGDNVKFLETIPIEMFDIIDLDAYGSPFKQLQIIFKRQYSGIVHCTFIQSSLGKIDNKLLNIIGYSKRMIEKCPCLFSRNGLKKILYYLNNNNISEIIGYFIDRKNYFYFKM